MLRWIVRNQDRFVAPVVLGAVVLSFFVSNNESARRDAAQRSQLITGCTRSSERSVLDAAYKQETSDVRRSTSKHEGDADWKAANEYQKFALGGLRLIPMPAEIAERMKAGTLRPSEALLKAVVEGTNESGDKVYRLSEAARDVVHAGCVEAYS